MASGWNIAKKTQYPGIRQTKEGLFIVQARVRDEHGKARLRQKTLEEGAKLEDAVLERARMTKNLRNEACAGKEQVPPVLGDYALRWLKRKSGENLRPHTLEGYLVALDNHICPFLGDLRVDEISTKDILAWKDKVCSRLMKNGKPYGAWTIGSWFSVLRNIMSDIVLEYDLPKNPCQGVRAPRKPKAPRKERTLSSAQLSRFLYLNKLHCNQHYAIALVLALYGLRWEEASALHWEHVDEEAGEIRVVQSQVRRKVHPTKNENIKVLPLQEEVVAALEEHKTLLVTRRNEGLKDGLVFPDKNGRYRLSSSVSKAWAVISKEMGLAWTVTPHDLRRSYQNLLRQASVSMVVQQALMGHSSDAMTNHYSNVDMAEKRQAQAQVVDLLKVRGANG